MAQHDEVTISCGARGEIDVTDEQMKEPYLVGLSLSEGTREWTGGYAYLELTRDETVKLRDELTRRIEASDG